MSKTNVKSFSKGEKQGQVFSMNILDDSGEIRCTFFDELCEKYKDIEVSLFYFC